MYLLRNEEPSLTQGSPAWSTGAGKRSFHRGNPSTPVRQKVAGYPDVLFKKARTWTNSHSGNHPGLWQRNNDLGGVRDIKVETVLCDFKARAGGRATIVSILSPPPTWLNLNLHWPSEIHSFDQSEALRPHPT